MTARGDLRSPKYPLPLRTVLGWVSWTGAARTSNPALGDLPHQCPASSGRAALIQALLAIRLPAGSAIPLPTYHCLSMGAAVLTAGLTLAAERRWRDRRVWALIEDCARRLLGQAGERSVGRRGGYVIDSVVKVFPVRMGTLLASAHRPSNTPLARARRRPGGKAELRTMPSLLAHAPRHERLIGVSTSRLERLLHRRPPTGRKSPRVENGMLVTASPPALTAYEIGRRQQAACASSEWLRQYVSRARTVNGRKRTRQRFAHYAATLPGILRWQATGQPPPTAPYVLPLWVTSESDPIYQRLRESGVLNFLWDGHWPGAEPAGNDGGARAVRHLLQLPRRPDNTDNTDNTEDDLRWLCNALTLAMQSHSRGTEHAIAAGRPHQ